MTVEYESGTEAVTTRKKMRRSNKDVSYEDSIVTRGKNEGVIKINVF